VLEMTCGSVFWERKRRWKMSSEMLLWR
jgi:hypothetical protein